MSEHNSLIPSGRFAPSPTGPLHLGSLYTALASYLDARAHGGKWLLRIDDIDTPRNVSGAVDAILFTLDAFQLYWDDSIYYQSQHLEQYEYYLTQLDTYPCNCSRKFLEQMGIGEIYNAHCRELAITTKPAALRIKTEVLDITFTDLLQGFMQQNIAFEHGDFILKRKDGLFAYQFAVVIDDYLQQITHVVRGYDLLTSTIKQIYLQQLLGFPSPQYAHVPLITDIHGNKLSKQTKAKPVETKNKEQLLFYCLQLLQQNPPLSLKTENLTNQLQWAIQHWNPAALKQISQQQI